MRSTKLCLIFVTILSLLFFFSQVCFSAPNTISYQGKLTDSDGTPVPDDTYYITFVIWGQETGDPPLWGEWQNVDVSNGIFNVVLGTGNPLENSPPLDEVFTSGEDRWLSIQVETETLSPRQKIMSVAYAMQAQKAESVNDNSVVTGMLQDQSVDQTKLADNAVSSAKIQDSSITNADIAPGLDADTVDGLEGASLEESSEIDADIASHTSVASAHHTKTTSFSELTDSATDIQIPNDITINEATNADTVDGQHASAFADVLHDHSALNAADGYPLNAVSVDSGGSVGIGTTSPDEKLHVSGSSNPRIMIEATDTSNPELNLKSSGTNDWAIYKNGSSGDLRFYQLGDKVTIQEGTGNVGIGINNPEQKLHVNGLATFELGAGKIHLTTPGSRPGLIAIHNDGTRSDVVFHDEGIVLSKSEYNAIPDVGNGLFIHENGRVGVGTISPSARLEIRGEVRTTDVGGASRLWGQGRPGTKRYGITGEESGLCMYGEVYFGLSEIAVNWGAAAAACPAGTWVCTDAERGPNGCDTAREDIPSGIINLLVGDGINCEGTYIDEDPDKHTGWLADQQLRSSDDSESGKTRKEDGTNNVSDSVCRYYPVWCCSSVFE